MERVADYCTLIHNHQQVRHVKGAIAEIGVHHGLFFTLLNTLTHNDEHAYAFDVFSKQELNIDQSGWGSKQHFEDNLKKYCRHEGKNVTIVECDSTTTDLTDHIKEKVRLFSVDGGHTVEHTISDLRQAHKVLHPEGVVILDDMPNIHWLGVIEGCIRFLQERPTLVPFAIGHNKAFLCNMSYVEVYKQLFRDTEFVTKDDVEFVGHKILAV